MKFYLGRTLDGKYELSSIGKQDWDPKVGFYFNWFPYKDLGDILQPGEMKEIELIILLEDGRCTCDVCIGKGI